MATQRKMAPLCPLRGLSMITIYTESNASAKDFPFGHRIANALNFICCVSGENRFWPHDLAVFYPFPHHIPVWQIIGSFALIIFIKYHRHHNPQTFIVSSDRMVVKVHHSNPAGCRYHSVRRTGHGRPLPLSAVHRYCRYNRMGIV